MPHGSWKLWVSRGSERPLSTELAAAEPGVLPTPASRTAALASLGYRPADPASGWTWQEFETRAGLLRIVGRTAVVALNPVPAPARPPQLALAHLKKQPLTSQELGALLGPEAAEWPGLGLEVWRGGILRHMADQQVKVYSGGVLIGFTEQSTAVPEQRIYQAVVHIDHEGLPYGAALPPGVMPSDPIKAHEDANARFNS